MSTSFLTIAGLESSQVSATTAAFEKRDNLALDCGTVRVVANAAQAEHAASILKEVKGFTRLMEESRKVVKEPVLAIGKKIDGLAKELTEFLENEAGRISKLLGTYQLEQARLAREAAEKAEAEERRIREETQAAIERAENLSRTQEAAERKIEKIEAKAFDQIANARASAVLAAPPKLTGLAAKMATKFEVEDLHALYRTNPGLVILTPNTAAINAILRSAPGTSLPGLRVYQEAQAIVR